MLEQRFLAILRRHLPLIAPSDELALDAPLRELGLDSMATVRLVMELERELGVVLPDSRLTIETFMDAASVWDAVRATMEV
ncbi:MAG TPA: phosphopantetheine-binding protein [Kofleriaceae bacterium]